MSKSYLEIKIPGTSTVVSCEGWPATILFSLMISVALMAFAFGLAGILAVLFSAFPHLST